MKATAGRMMQSLRRRSLDIGADRGSDEKKNREGRKGLEKDLKKHGIGHKGVGGISNDRENWSLSLLSDLKT